MQHPVIDIHCHAAGIGAGGSGCFISPAMRKSWKFGIYLRAFGVTEKELLEQGDQLLIERLSLLLGRSTKVHQAVVLALDSVMDREGNVDRSRTEVFIPNDFIASTCRRHGNLLFDASINPNRPDALDRLEQAAANGAVLLKWLPSIQGIDPANESLIPFYERLRDLKLPLLTHTGEEESFTCKDDRLGDPELLRLPLKVGVTVIAAHAASNGRNGGEANFDRFLRLCEEFPNLYGDISALTQLNRLSHLPRLLKHRELHGRLLYGTDMPLLNTAIVMPLAFAYRISPRRLLTISRIRNPWDQDVALKEALGLPVEVFTNANTVLRLPASAKPLDSGESL
jgi:predicted TIM-barrel fold metal-dependent hydrolase